MIQHTITNSFFLKKNKKLKIEHVNRGYTITL